jgi:hypothetical protein
MVTEHDLPSDGCADCGAPTDGETAYRRPLHTSHDPAELGAIDRRRGERDSREANVVRASDGAAASLAGLRDPDAGTAVSYGVFHRTGGFDAHRA